MISVKNVTQLFHEMCQISCCKLDLISIGLAIREKEQKTKRKTQKLNKNFFLISCLSSNSSQRNDV